MSVARHANARPLVSATQGTFGWDLLRVTTFTTHLLIMAYVSVGWTASTRIGLLFYLLLLPVIIMQWLLNDGVSNSRQCGNCDPYRPLARHPQYS